MSLRSFSLLLLLTATGLPALAQQPVLPSRRETTGKPQSKPQTEKPETVAPAPPLALAEAIRLGVESNYAIRVSQQDVRVAENNVTRGNAGQLPVVNGNFVRTFNRNNQRQEFSQGDPRITNNVSSKQLQANVAGTWTIFDGLGMFIAYDRLRTLEQGQRQLTRAVVEETVAAISDAYFVVVRESGKITSLEEALKIGQARIDLTQARVDVGVSAKVEVLTARVDYNADRSALIQQQEALKTAKINLNALLGRPPGIDFRPLDSIVVARDLERDAVLTAIRQYNPRLEQARTSIAVADYDRRLVRASRFPRVGLTSGYSRNSSFNGASFLPGTRELGTATSYTNGFNYGVVATIPIFDGFNKNRLEQNARIGEEQARLELDQLQLQLAADAEQAFAQYQNRLALLELEESNILLARENVAIALERYRLGLLTPLALREAQRTQLQAETRLLDIRYQAKQAEIVLRRLSSGLVREGQAQP
ncbi:TolC family protein [Hymenobacter actinosclerus]|uniref:Outer membrane protein TolC n=1 Tax=Hymenobacter actinosclerus TaxID=82805 RepID=A0A1I0GNP2_9BACT|nr:TolC family protein [Hymenobacter actinosclerus]SET72934.1 Outer membrane protein TolC [Hymenobacter actinosclerus]